MFLDTIYIKSDAIKNSREFSGPFSKPFIVNLIHLPSQLFRFYEILFSLELWIILNTQTIWIFSQKMSVARAVISVSPGIVEATVICYHFIYSSQVTEKKHGILPSKSRIRTPADVWRKIWGLIYIIVFLIFSLHLMSNALSNWKSKKIGKKLVAKGFCEN